MGSNRGSSKSSSKRRNHHVHKSDEISVRKGHKYITIVMDLERGNVIYAGDGKGADALNEFWKRPGRHARNIRAICTDMSPACIAAVMEHIPSVPLVFDHFHLVKLVNDTLTEIRRGLYHELKDTMGKDVIKGMRWFLLKIPKISPKKKMSPPD